MKAELDIINLDVTDIITTSGEGNFDDPGSNYEHDSSEGGSGSGYFN